MRFRIAADTGGTFTDIALSAEGQDPVIGKALTTPDRIFEGIEAAIGNAAEPFGMTAAEVIGLTDVFIYGTTHATNAVVTENTAKTALLCTKGFPDTLVLREGGKRSAFDFRIEYPKAYIPRSLTFEVTERIDAEGGVVEALEEKQVELLLHQMKDAGVEAIAVSLLWSIVNPAHEQIIGRLIERYLPGVPFTLSHQLNPIVREYRRTSSAAIDASLKPLMQNHLSGFQQDIGKRGFKGSLLAVTSIGGAMHVEDLIERPIYTVRSGPAMAPVAAATYGTVERAPRDLIVCDTGGTTFDVSLIREGHIKQTRETWLGGRFTGNITGMSSVDVQSIGSGGGSIAWIDSGGLLRVGPRSAGAKPGPVCYGRGGSEPTVTDAALILGFLDPAHFLGGKMTLDTDGARRAISDIAARLGRGVEETAYAIYLIATEAMVGAIREITIEEGIDPRECGIVAGGGAAGLNVAAMAAALEVDCVLVPRTAGALSACGGLYSDVMTEASATRLAITADFPREEINQVLEDLESSLMEMAETLRARGLDGARVEYAFEARYPFQSWELEVPLPFSRFRSDADVETLRRAFHATHERVFAVSEPDQDVECLFWRARLVVPLGEQITTPDIPAETFTPTPRATGSAFFGKAAVETSRYEGTHLVRGSTVTGPAIIDEATTTIVLPPGSTLTATEYNYVINVANGV